MILICQSVKCKYSRCSVSQPLRRPGCAYVCVWCSSKMAAASTHTNSVDIHFGLGLAGFVREDMTHMSLQYTGWVEAQNQQSGLFKLL